MALSSHTYRLDALKTEPDTVYWCLTGICEPINEGNTITLGLLNYELDEGISISVDLKTGEVYDCVAERLLWRVSPQEIGKPIPFALVLERYGDNFLPTLWIGRGKSNAIACPAYCLQDCDWLCPVYQTESGASSELLQWWAWSGSALEFPELQKILSQQGFDINQLAKSKETRR